MAQVTFLLPAYLAKYYKHHHGAEISIEQARNAGARLKWITNQLNLFSSPQQKKEKHLPHIAIMQVVIPVPHTAPGAKPVLTAENQKKLIKKIEQQFITDLHHYVQANSTPGTQYAGIMQTVEQFLTRYQISLEEDITTDCIKQQYFRWRRQQDLMQMIE